MLPTLCFRLQPALIGFTCILFAKFQSRFISKVRTILKVYLCYMTTQFPTTKFLWLEIVVSAPAEVSTDSNFLVY